MKCFTTILIVAAAIQVAVAGSEEMKKMFKDIGMKCGAEFGVTEEMFQKFAGGDASGINAQQKCSAKCFFENIGMTDSAMNVNEAKVKEFLAAAPAEVHGALSDCAKINDADPCEKAFKMIGCIMKSVKGA